MNRSKSIGTLLILAWPGVAAAQAATTSELEQYEVVVTASKVPWDLAAAPAMVSIVQGSDLRTRGASDLRRALSLTSGLDVAPGGDTGPAGSVPGMWGLKEFDAFLLVVDGVPYGGAFNPALPTLDLVNVDRIEVVRGSAPVTYGPTSFVGVIQVLHAPAGSVVPQVSASAGTRGTARLQASGNLSAAGTLRQSLSIDAQRERFSQDDSSLGRLHGLYRTTIDVGGGTLAADFDWTLLRQDPYSPHPREGAGITDRFVLDANVNPRDARQNQDRGQINLKYSRSIGSAALKSTLSVAQTETDAIRGFLREDFAVDGVTHNADGFRQHVRTTDLYFDTCLTWQMPRDLQLALGVDWLYGSGTEKSGNFEYAVLPDGANRPLSKALPVDERTVLKDRRNFGGLYAQLNWQPTRDWLVSLGMRLNRTDEWRVAVAIPTGEPAEDTESDARVVTRLTGVAAASYRLWSRASDHVTLFADVRSSYKPAAMDFGPEAEGGILRPETGKSSEVGLRGRLLGGRFNWESSLFQMDFRNLVIRENIDGLPGLANAGRERFRGAELEATWAMVDSMRIIGTYSYHEAKFTDYAREQPDGSLQQLAGNDLELSPHHLAAVGILRSPKRGWLGSAVVSWTGERFLNKSNTSVARGFAMLDASLGYRSAHWELRVDGANLGNRRDPVTESELGDAQFYRLSGRSVVLSLTYSP